MFEQTFVRSSIIRLLKRLDFASMEFSVYFLGYEAPENIPAETDPQQLFWLFSQKAVLSLTQYVTKEPGESKGWALGRKKGS